ncbi:UV-stimulated scaffold protein A [Acipenser ruthenus]|uniref:UV-stimulated scaffold protein A n=1 Tax=Acipenser ruthenus TaxID=7906 RepID=A0A444UGN7_ACIRT|nr:UV-stimulated scaffold protein A [Acipenser ruthenus]
MDHQQREKLSELVEQLTTSGEPQLSPAKMKVLKQICRASEEYIDHVYHLIMAQLNQKHAEVRLAAFQIASELFVRSHQFRTLLVSNFQEFLELTVETDPSEQPLPPPKEVARKLKKMAIEAVQEWQGKYGEAYKKLALGYHFLKQVKKVDFHDVEARTLAERKREEEKQKRLERIYKEKLLMPDPVDFAITDFEPSSTETDIGSKPAAATPSQSDSGSSWQEYQTTDHEQPCCSKDLRPHATEQTGREEEEESDEQDSDMESVPDEESFIRNTGLISHKYNLTLDVSTDLKVQENEDNSAVVSNIRDLQRLITTKHLPAVQTWLQVYTKAGVNDERLKRAIDFKSALEAVVKKHEDMHINYKRRDRKVMKAAADDDEEDDDFEEVPEKEGYEPHIPDHLRGEYGLDPAPALKPATVKRGRPVRPAVPHLPPRPKRSVNDEELDPTCAAATLRLLKHRLQPAPSTSMPESSKSAACAAHEPGGSEGGEVQEEEKAQAPVMPFGLDLYYWGQDQPTAGKIIKYVHCCCKRSPVACQVKMLLVIEESQFWVPHEVEEEVENPELSALVKTRYITFAGKFEPVKHKCRAPLPNGALCERQDRVKCPFHGLIIPRDELGNPTNPEDAARLEREKRNKQEEQPDWRDPQLMREIEAATGVDLGSSKSFGKGKGSKGKGRKKKYPNLTDLKQNSNTARSRLEKKVFSKGSVKRVTEAMNRIDKRKHEKFANQFNYALN